VLARNEVERDYAYNRALFKRVAQGWYQLNPQLAVRRRDGETEIWVAVYRALNLPLINEFARGEEWHWRDDMGHHLDPLFQRAGLPAHTTPIAAERTLARAAAEEQRRAEAAAAEDDAWRRFVPASNSSGSRSGWSNHSVWPRLPPSPPLYRGERPRQNARKSNAFAARSRNTRTTDAQALCFVPPRGVGSARSTANGPGVRHLWGAP